jgi:hypothetical protein
MKRIKITPPTGLLLAALAIAAMTQAKAQEYIFTTLELTAVPANVAVFASPQRLPDGSFQLTLIGQTNQSYTLQVSTNLTTWTDWTNVAPASFSTPLTDPIPAHDPQRFYRARTRYQPVNKVGDDVRSL